MSHLKVEHKCTAGFYAICILKQASYKVVGKVGNECATAEHAKDEEDIGVIG